jgi:hypothetical protein
MIAGEIRKRLARTGFKVKETHREIGKWRASSGSGDRFHAEQKPTED